MLDEVCRANTICPYSTAHRQRPFKTDCTRQWSGIRHDDDQAPWYLDYMAVNVYAALRHAASESLRRRWRRHEAHVDLPVAFIIREVFVVELISERPRESRCCNLWCHHIARVAGLLTSSCPGWIHSPETITTAQDIIACRAFQSLYTLSPGYPSESGLLLVRVPYSTARCWQLNFR